MHIRYRVELEESERQQLEAIVAGGTRAVRRVKRAQILLAAAAGVSDAEIFTVVVTPEQALTRYFSMRRPSN